jgi:hypothetical protein
LSSSCHDFVDFLSLVFSKTFRGAVFFAMQTETISK